MIEFEQSLFHRVSDSSFITGCCLEKHPGKNLSPEIPHPKLKDHSHIKEHLI